MKPTSQLCPGDRMGVFETLVLRFDTGAVLATLGILVGMLFGASAQRSRFCLRAAVIEFVTLRFGEKLAIWLLTFGVAITLVLLLLWAGAL